jgi:hypothetical protein
VISTSLLVHIIGVRNACLQAAHVLKHALLYPLTCGVYQYVLSTSCDHASRAWHVYQVLRHACPLADRSSITAFGCLSSSDYGKLHTPFHLRVSSEIMRLSSIHRSAVAQKYTPRQTSTKRAAFAMVAVGVLLPRHTVTLGSKAASRCFRNLSDLKGVAHTARSSKLLPVSHQPR